MSEHGKQSNPTGPQRVVNIETPAKPVTFEEWRKVIETHFPALLRPAEVCLSVVAQLLINDISNPFALALVDVPSSGKTITLNFFSGAEELIYTSDNFTPAAFVSHASNVKRQDLEKVDLLPRIRHRMLIIRELGSMFSAKDDDLVKNFGVLTRVLDGEGLETDSGVHGKRDYQGDYLFMLVGGTPPIPPRVFKVMGNFGSRLFFLALHTPEETDDDLISQNRGEDRKSREDACKVATTGFLRTIWAANQSGIAWNKANDPEDCLRVIAQCARLLAALRGAINVWAVGEDQKLTHSVPTIEKPNRINCLFYNLARGHALACGRLQISPADLWPVLDLTFDSAPSNRAKIFRALIENGGRLTTDEVVKALHCSKPTALKEMEALSILGVVDKTDGVGSCETYIELAEKFEWFTSEECNDLMAQAERVRDHSWPLASVKEIDPCVSDRSDDLCKANRTLCTPVVLSNETDAFSALMTTTEKSEDTQGVKSFTQTADDAHAHLVELLNVIGLEAKDGLYPAGDSEVTWGHDPDGRYYPAEYTSAYYYVQDELPSEDRAFDELASLLHKIDAEAWKGTPLTSSVRQWCGDGYPPEYHAAKAYVQRQWNEQERALLAEEA